MGKEVKIAGLSAAKILSGCTVVTGSIKIEIRAGPGKSIQKLIVDWWWGSIELNIHLPTVRLVRAGTLAPQEGKGQEGEGKRGRGSLRFFSWRGRSFIVQGLLSDFDI